MLTVEQAFPTKVAGVIRTPSDDVAFDACIAAIEGGMGTIEITMTVPSCLDIVRRLLASTSGTVPVGVGTVFDAATVEAAKDAGASFVVTPVVLPEVVAACQRVDLLCVLGAMTPTEIHQARMAGANLVKVFPVASAGGPTYIRYVSGPMPDVPLWVSGGVEIEEIPRYLELSTVKAIGLTTSLFAPDLLARRDMAEITRRAQRAAAFSPAPA
jgi:2-dehydro-3-deoxyphosphogluconate aldolase / (4S)-4-hydroxy-2-oxoglutarate aldolase